MLKNVITENQRVLTGLDVPREYFSARPTKRALDIHALVFPKSHDEVVGLVNYANRKDLKIIARGAGTGVAEAQYPIHGNELIIDFKLMDQILSLDEETFTLTVQPGAILGDIHRYVEERGFYYPPDPASKHSSIGGNVATNAGGLRALKYGTTRNFIRELQLVLASGEEMTLGSLNIKSSSGYNLLNLMIGSEGTLGIVTEIKLKLLPLPAETSSVLLAFDNVFQATDATLAILKAGVHPAGIELFEKDAVFYAEELLDYPLQSQKGSAYLLVEVEGNNQKAIEEDLGMIIQATAHLAVEAIPFFDKEEGIKAKKIRDNILLGLMKYTEYEMLDEVVPINKFAELIQYTKLLQEKHGIEVINFGHAGDGNVHTVLMKRELTEEEWTSKRKALLDDLYAEVARLGGLPSAEHGIGLVKKEYFEKMTDEVSLKYMRKIKEVFDPDNRLNPGKLL